MSPATNWPRVSVVDVCESIVDCVNKTAPVVDYPTPYKMIRTTNVRDGWVDLSSVRFVDEATFEKWTRRQRPRRGDVILTREAPLGEVGLLRSDDCIFLGQRLVAYRADPRKIDNRFLLYAMLGDDTQGQIRSMGSGATVEHMRVPDCEKLTLRLPPIAVQQRIASILSAYDDLIENNTRRIAILEEMARRIYEEWFVRFRFPGHENVRMVESELGLVPEGWETVRMEDVCARITDGSHYSPKSIETGKPMASVKDMHDWGINVGTCRQIAEDEYEKLVRNDCKPRLNDILIAKDGSYLKHTFVVDQEIDLVILSSIAILRPNGRMLPNQLAMYLRLPDVASRMKGYVSGVAIPRIVLRDFRQFLVLLPPAKVQRAWAAHCDSMLRLCRNLVRKNENLRTTRDLLLPKLISGELSVENIEIAREAP